MMKNTNDAKHKFYLRDCAMKCAWRIKYELEPSAMLKEQ